MKREFPNGPLICLALILLFIGMVVYREKNKSLEKAVEQMHVEVNKAQAAEEAKVIKPTQSWGGNPTNSPVCAAPVEEL